MTQQDFGWLQATVDELRVQLAKEQAKTLRYFEMVRTLEEQQAALGAQVEQLMPWALNCTCGGADASCAAQLDDRFTWGRKEALDQVLRLIYGGHDE